MCCLLRRAQRPHGPTQQHQPRNSSVAAAWLRLMPALHHRRVAAVMSRDRSACAETMYNVWFRIGGRDLVLVWLSTAKTVGPPTRQLTIGAFVRLPSCPRCVRSSCLAPHPPPPLFHDLSRNNCFECMVGVPFVRGACKGQQGHDSSAPSTAARAQGGCCRLRRSRHVGSACSCLLCRA